MIKLKGKHEAAHEIQGVLRDQIKYKKDAERKAKIEKQSVRGFYKPYRFQVFKGMKDTLLVKS